MPGLEITPAVPASRMVIQSYGGGRFRVAGEVYESAILVFRENCLTWPAETVAELDAAALAEALRTHAGEALPEILVVGCGARFVAPPAGFRAALKAHGVALEWMDTGAACRTFNVLLGEDRRAAAVILAVD